MVTNGLLKVDDTFLKTQSIKESPFDAAGFPSTLKEALSFLKRPGEAVTLSVPSPRLNAYPGVKIGASSTTVGREAGFGTVAERPQLNNLDGYYFPLGSDLKGSDLSDIRENILKPVAKVETIQEGFESQEGIEYKTDPMFIYGQGLTPSSNNVNNLKTTSYIKSSWTNANVTTLRHNITSSADGVIINPVIMSEDTVSTYTITPDATDYYCFSFYARLDGRNFNTLNNTRYIKISIDPPVDRAYVVSEDVIIGENYALLNLKFEWKRYAAVMFLEEGITYTLKLNWFYKDSSLGDTSINLRAYGLKVAGVLLEKGKKISPYEVRHSNVSGESQIENIIYHLSIFNLDSLADNISQNKGWIISYKRKIFDEGGLDFEHCDSLGDLYWGYSSGQIVASNFNEMDPPFISLSDYYLNWEHVILRHKENENIIDLYVEVTNSNKEYHFEIDISGIDLTGTFQGVDYDLLLGCKKESFSNLSDVTYKDLIYVLDGSDSSLQKVKNNTMGIFTSDITVSNIDEETTGQAVVLTDMNILEKSYLEY